MLKEDYKIYEGKDEEEHRLRGQRDFASVRAGRANAAVLDRIMVDYYGSPTPIQQIAAISSPDARTLLISSLGTSTAAEEPLKRPSRTPIWASTPRTTAPASA